jgi:tRNA dimethylallyltransferase
VGYKEVISYLNGEVSIDDCKKEVIKNTKKLAKKQLTWFKADPRINWLRTDNYDNIFNLIIDAIRIITRDIAQGYNFHE